MSFCMDQPQPQSLPTESILARPKVRLHESQSNLAVPVARHAKILEFSFGSFSIAQNVFLYPNPMSTPISLDVAPTLLLPRNDDIPCLLLALKFGTPSQLIKSRTRVEAAEIQGVSVHLTLARYQPRESFLAFVACLCEFGSGFWTHAQMKDSVAPFIEAHDVSKSLMHCAELRGGVLDALVVDRDFPRVGVIATE